jgi:hypothetical protein
MADGRDDLLPERVQAARRETQEERDADDHVLRRAVEREGRGVPRRGSAVEVAPALAVAVRLHVCRVHAVVRVELWERERAHDAQARRRTGATSPCSSLGLVTRQSSIDGASRLRKSTRSCESTASAPSYVPFGARCTFWKSTQ